MTQRERFLALAIGGLVLALAFNWGFGKYRTGLNKLRNQADGLRDEGERLNDRIIQGLLADRQMGEYQARSLSSDPEIARSVYQKWLMDTVKANGLKSPIVDPTNSTPVGDLFRYQGFRVSGKTKMPDVVKMLHAFYAKDYLHRIRELSLNPDREGGLVMEMSIDASFLNRAPVDPAEPKETSYRLTDSLASYEAAILNRNMFRPPNGEPEFTGRTEIEAIIGQESRSQLSFKDPEGDRIRYEWAGKTPEIVTLDENSGALRIKSDAKGEFEFLVRAIDSGYPNRTVEQKLVIKVNDPPPPPEPEKPKLKFDDATQTVLTALVQGGNNEWTAWLNVRTRGKTLKLRAGDQFEVGTVTGKVFGIEDDFATMEVDGRRFDMKLNGKLSEAVTRAMED